MKLFVFAVRDRATDAFGTPMFMVSAGQVIRSFTAEVNRADKDNQLFNHSGDFDLYELASFDAETGLFEGHPPRLIARAQDLRVSN